MCRESFMIGFTLSCMVALAGIGKADADSSVMSFRQHPPPVLNPGQAAREHKECSDPVIVTQDGPLRGISFPGINVYLGIPYAAPPVGTLRWTPPQPHGRWQGVLDANQLGNVCPQLDDFGTAIGNEDCLFLNVFTPGSKNGQVKHSGLPVMVWIHGGAMVAGSGNWYDPTPLVTKGDVIVVTLNYRLGALGFFGHQALDAEGHLNANYGLMDQQFALRWVKRTIAKFGGDPNRVTIFGESAGGLSVFSNLASPTAAGLFHRAIAQSGAYGNFSTYDQTIFDLPYAEYLGSIFAGMVGCDSQTAECLRATPADVLVKKQPGAFFPIVDGTVLTQPPDKAFAGGQFNRMPVIVGSTHDEARLNIAMEYDYKGKQLTDDDYPAAVAKSFGMSVDDWLIKDVVLGALYPLSNYTNPIGPWRAPLALGALWTDSGACQERTATRLLAHYVPTYEYEFNDQNAPLGLLPPVSFPMGAYHSSEIQYLFRPLSQFEPDQQQLSDAMVAYWTRFAAHGNPNSLTLPVWLPYNANSERVQSLVPPIPAVKFDFDADHKCSSFWDLL
jgi:para-nitrobenzyl esterase